MGELPSPTAGRNLIGTVAEETPKLELDRAPFKAGWGRVARQLRDEANNTMNQLEVMSP